MKTDDWQDALVETFRRNVCTSGDLSPSRCFSEGGTSALPARRGHPRNLRHLWYNIPMTNLPAGGQSVPQLYIPRHPLWVNAYNGAWDLWFRQPMSCATARSAVGARMRAAQDDAAPRSGADTPAACGTGQAASISALQSDACAFALYARYAHDMRQAASLLELFHAADTSSPLLAWVEWKFYQATGDCARLARVFPSLVAHYERRKSQSRRTSGLYWDVADESGSPREAHEWVDASAQTALAAECMAEAAHALEQNDREHYFRHEWREQCERINRLCWDEPTGFFLDRRANGSRSPVKSIAGLWSLTAGVPSPAQAERLAAHLSDPREFWRIHVFPNLSADHPRYAERGAYWRGSVWSLHNYAVIHGLQRYGYDDLALRAADNHVTTISHVYKETLSHWENYMPDYIEPGSIARPDFVPSAGIGAVALLLEVLLGLQIDAPARTLHWTPRLREPHRIERLRLGNLEATLEVAEAETPSRFQAALSVSAQSASSVVAPLNLHLVLPDGERRLEVRDQIRFQF